MMKSTSLLVLFALLNLIKAIDYPGGWNKHHNGCKSICDSKTSHRTCLQPVSLECLSKQNLPGDYDDLVLEHLYIPEYCRSLARGVDPTLSHRQVLPFPQGTQCLRKNSGYDTNQWMIHGLWPNYERGFPACCAYPDSNAILHPSDIPESLLGGLNRRWKDPVMDSHESMCNLWNHEYQKHGTCLGKSVSASVYLNGTLQVAQQLDDIINTLKQHFSGKMVPISSLQALFTHNVRFLCSNTTSTHFPLLQKSKNRLLAIQTCWLKPTTGLFPTMQKDCSYDQNQQQMCNPDFLIDLTTGYDEFLTQTAFA